MILSSSAMLVNNRLTKCQLSLPKASGLNYAWLVPLPGQTFSFASLCLELCSQFRIFSLLSSGSLGWVRVVVVCPAESVRPPFWPAQVQTRARVTPGHQHASSSVSRETERLDRDPSPQGNFQKFLKGFGASFRYSTSHASGLRHG